MLGEDLPIREQLNVWFWTSALLCHHLLVVLSALTAVQEREPATAAPYNRDKREILQSGQGRCGLLAFFCLTVVSKSEPFLNQKSNIEQPAACALQIAGGGGDTQLALRCDPP